MTTPLRLAFEGLNILCQTIISSQHKLVYLAGASASGKSHIGEQLVQQLQDAGKKVLLISSDSYYANDSNLKYLLYGTFDHPKLIDYDRLQSDLEEYFTSGTITLPTYSFVEKRRTHLTPISEQFDIIIVEGLYTISQLRDTIITPDQTVHAYKIFVESSSEEIIFRRLLRDQARVKEPLHTIIGVMSNVFPMWTLFGDVQSSQADCIMTNEYRIIDKEGITSRRKPITTNPYSQELLQKTHYMRGYIYNDSHDDNGKIIISEVYTDPHGLLDHVKIHKRTDDPRHDTPADMNTSYESISMTLYQPAISTELHILLQLAGLQYEGSYDKIVYYYNNPEDPDHPITIKEKFGALYQLIPNQTH